MCDRLTVCRAGLCDRASERRYQKQSEPPRAKKATMDVTTTTRVRVCVCRQFSLLLPFFGWCVGRLGVVFPSLPLSLACSLARSPPTHSPHTQPRRLVVFIGLPASKRKRQNERTYLPPSHATGATRYKKNRKKKDKRKPKSHEARAEDTSPPPLAAPSAAPAADTAAVAHACHHPILSKRYCTKSTGPEGRDSANATTTPCPLPPTHTHAAATST